MPPVPKRPGEPVSPWRDLHPPALRMISSEPPTAPPARSARSSRSITPSLRETMRHSRAACHWAEPLALAKPAPCTTTLSRVPWGRSLEAQRSGAVAVEGPGAPLNAVSAGVTGRRYLDGPGNQARERAGLLPAKGFRHWSCLWRRCVRCRCRRSPAIRRKNDGHPDGSVGKLDVVDIGAERVRPGEAHRRDGAGLCSGARKAPSPGRHTTSM
jgi:hypothetical protein